MTQFVIPRISEITVRCEGTRVLLLSNGRLLADLPWEAALALARALGIKAREAEEEAKAELLIFDQAILTRLGLPFGLTRRLDMLKAAANEAAWNPSLRRYIRGKRAGGIESQAVFGTPSIISHAPPKGSDDD